MTKKKLETRHLICFDECTNVDLLLEQVDGVDYFQLEIGLKQIIVHYLKDVVGVDTDFFPERGFAVTEINFNNVSSDNIHKQRP